MSGHAAAWDEYWQSLPDAHLPATTGARASEALSGFWSMRLKALFERMSSPRVVDLACGQGVVLREAIRVAESVKADAEFFAADYSPAASLALKKVSQIPPIHTLCADLEQSPLAPESFDVVVSQFGLEYAGSKAFSLAAESVRPRGQLVLVCHCEDGAIHAECSQNLVILNRFAEAGIFAGIRGYLEKVYREGVVRRGDNALLAGMSDVYQAAGQGDCAAGPYIQRLLTDMGQLCERALAYDPKDAFGWLSSQELAHEAYQMRMRSMLQAALTAGDVDKICADLSHRGFDPISSEQLTLEGSKRPTAWVVEASRSG